MKPDLDGWVLQAGLFVPDGSLESLPYSGVHEHVSDVEHQIAAVGGVNGTGPEHGVVAKIRPHERSPLDSPEQISPVGVGLDDDGGRLRVGVVHEYAYLKWQERVPLGGTGELLASESQGARLLAGIASEQVQVVEGILFQRRKIGDDLGPISPPRYRLDEQLRELPAPDLPAQAFYFVHGLFLDSLEALHRVLNLLKQACASVLYGPPLLLIQLHVLLGRDRGAFTRQGVQVYPGLRELESKVLRPHLLFQPL